MDFSELFDEMELSKKWNKPPLEVRPELKEGARAIGELFQSLVDNGFTRSEALTFIIGVSRGQTS